MSQANPGDHRRKWDLSEYEQIARDRADIERSKSSPNDDAIKREMLKPRDYKVDLDSHLGKSQVITKTTPASQSGGYYCNVCDCVVKDSINFLDHINGKKHQRNMGMSMKVERSTLDQVKKRFEVKKKQAEEKTKELELNERLKAIKEEQDKHQAYKREKKRKRKAANNIEYEVEEDSEMAALMGFSGFSKGNKNN